MSSLIDRIRRCDTLPTLPAAALSVLELTGDEASLNALSDMITKDAALSVKVLRAVNSPFYGLSQKVSTVAQAVPLLGMQTVKSLVLSFTLVSTLRDQKDGGFDFLSYWRRSMYAATAARVLAAKFLAAKQEECFVAALLMDVGTVLMRNVLRDQYDAIYESAHCHQDLALIERHEFGIAHPEAAALMARHWGLPESLATPIAAHHGPQEVAEPELKEVAQIIWLSGRCAEIFVNIKGAAEAISAVRATLRELYQLDETQSDALLTQIGQKTGELAGLFEVRINATTFEQVVTTASQRLLEMSISQRDAASGAPDKRAAKRIRRDGRISVTPCARGVLGRAIQMKLRDVSATGIGLSCNGRLEIGTQFLIQLPQEGGDVKSLLYVVKRCETVKNLSSIGGELISVLRPDGQPDRTATPTKKHVPADAK